MAASKIFSIRQLPILITSTCMNVIQRNYIKEQLLFKKMGYPEKPKRPPTGYASFLTIIRPSVKAKNPDMSFSEISAEISKKWKALPKDEKQKYLDMHAKQMVDYKEKMEEYNKGLTEKQRREMKVLKAGYEETKKQNIILRNVKKLMKEMNKPKSPVSAFVVYFIQNSERFPGQLRSELLKRFSEEWKNLPAKEKEKYITLYNKEKEQYKKDLEKWEKQMLQLGHVELVRLKTFKEGLKQSE